jgi:hypothetical protein
VWVQVAGHAKVHAIADEDLDRENDEKTSSVHFLRFELTPAMKQSLAAGADLNMGVEHPEYTAVLAPVPAAIRQSLLGDLSL